MRNPVRSWSRCLIALVLTALAGCAPLEQPSSANPALLEGEVPLRIVAANLTSGTRQSYDPGHGARILQGIDADVVLIQEFNYGDNSAATLRRFVDETFGPEFAFQRETGAQIPNAIISRHPIVEGGTWDDPYVSNRGFAWARIDLPGERDLWAVSVHLLTSGASVRQAEATSLIDRIAAQVPEEDYLVLGGDLNTANLAEPALSVLGAVVDANGPFPVDQSGNSGTNQSRSRPYDHVLADTDLAAHQVPTLIGAQSFPNGLVVDTRVYSPLADLAPAQAGDSAASQMQHMAVVKDFVLPGSVVVPPAGRAFVNEILANEPGTDAGYEFVELVGAGGVIDLSGWTISDAVAVRHVFPAGAAVAAGGRVVVFGAARGVPVGLEGASAASTGALGLNNGTDTLTIRDASGAVVQQITYDATLSGRDGVSMNRSPDGAPDAPFVLHNSLSTLSASPGTWANGAPITSSL